MCTAHNYLPKIAKCDDVEIVSGVAFCQDAGIEAHIDAIKNASEAYCFIYNNEGSVRFNTVEDCSFISAAEWFRWDYIIIHLNINASDDKCRASELAMIIKNICPSACVVLSAPYGVAADIADELAVLPVSEACEAAEAAGVVIVDADGSFRGREYGFITAGVWYEALSGNALTANSYRLPFVAGELTVLMKNAVHNTVDGIKNRCFNGR